jgi:hypothetical protein
MFSSSPVERSVIKRLGKDALYKEWDKNKWPW